MATNIRIETNRKAVRDFLKSDDVRYHMLQRAQAIQDAAGEGYVAVAAVGFDRAYGIVRTDTIEAKRDEAVNHTLLRSLHAGGGW